MRELLRDINFYSPITSTPPVRPVHLFVCGSTLTAQEILKGVEIRRGVILKRAHIALEVVRECKLEEVLSHPHLYANPVVIDCEESSETSTHYRTLLSRGNRILCLNRQALSSYKEGGREGLLIDTLIGGGLPLLSSLRDLTLTGDRVRKIEVVAGEDDSDLPLVISEVIKIVGWDERPYAPRGKVTVTPSSIASMSLDDPPSDRTFTITTDRYWDSSLVLQGPVATESLLAHVAISELLHALG